MKRIKVFPERDAKGKPTGDWRWQKWSGSDIISDSGEGYRNKSYCVERANAEADADPDPVEVQVEGDPE